MEVLESRRVDDEPGRDKAESAESFETAESRAGEGDPGGEEFFLLRAPSSHSKPASLMDNVVAVRRCCSAEAAFWEK